MHQHRHTDAGHYRTACTLQGVGVVSGNSGSGSCYSSGFGLGVGNQDNNTLSLAATEGRFDTGGRRKGNCNESGKGIG